MDLFELVGTIAIKNSDAIQALEETSKEGEKTESKLSKFFSGVGKAAGVAGKAIAAGLAVGASAMGALTVKALNLSGELEQNMGGSEAVFGKYADKMQDKAKEAFSNMGLSTSDYLATANKMGALFQGAGFSIEESMDLSSNAMQRAADVASIMGIDTNSAMEAIAGAAKGNFTMMDNLGVAMNDTTLNAYALEKGINKTTQEMTNQEKIALAMEMFMDKTAYAAGNYAKENQTLAGSLGTAKAALTNFLDGSGDVDSLVTSFSNAANVIVDNIKTLAPRLVTGLTDIVNQVVPMLPPLLNQLLPVIVNGAVSLVNGLVAALPGIISAIMSALPALIQGVTKIIEGLVVALPQILNMILQALPGILQTLFSALPTLLPLLINAVVDMIVMLCTMLPQIIQPIIDYLPAIIISIVNALMQNLPALIQGIISLVMGIIQALPQIIQALVDAIPQVVSMLVTGLLNALPQLIMGAIQLVMGIVKALPQILVSLAQALPNAFIGIWNGVKNVFSGVGDWFGNIFSGAKDKILNSWSNVKSKFSSMKDGIVNVFSNIKEKLSAPFTKARDAIKKVADKIKGFFKGEISMPKIKLPHFGISPKGWKIGDLLEGSIPKLGIEWYSKAMDKPMIMAQPTVFGYNAATGKLMGGGEAGSELVGGTNTVMGMIRAAVAEQNSAIAYYLQKIIEVLGSYFPQLLEALDMNVVLQDGVLVGRLAPKINEELGKISTRKDRGR